MMANELPRHFAAPGLGYPRTPRDVSFSLSPDDLMEVDDAVPFTESDAYATVSPVLPRMVSTAPPVESRMQPTVRVAGRSPFRRGAEAPSSSSLAIFVCLGLFVGLCAFVAMSIALPDNASASTAKTAMKPAVITPVPAATPAVPAPTQAIKVPQLVITADAPADPLTASAKPAPARRRAGKRPSTKTTLPSNPYNLP